MRKDLDGRADLWSMGVILYEMLTKKRIFHDKDAVSIIGRVMQMPITPPIEELEPGSIPQELNDIVMKAMERNVERRFQSAAEMRQALQQLLAHWRLAAATRSSARRLEDTGPSGVHSQSLARSGMLKSGVTSPSGPLSGSGSPTGATGSSSLVSRSGGFGTMLAGERDDVAASPSGCARASSRAPRCSIRPSASTRSRTACWGSGARSRCWPSSSAPRRASTPRSAPGAAARSTSSSPSSSSTTTARSTTSSGGTFTIMFGATRARVGDNMRALECALALKERFQLLEQGSEHIGLGVTYGEVFIASRKGGNAYGDAIDRCVELGALGDRGARSRR